MTAYIQKFNKEVLTLPYILGTSSKLKKEVYFQQDWIKMIQDHTVNILGWIQYEKVKWLQNNNPEVPGLVYKLTPTEEKVRKLKKSKRSLARYHGSFKKSEMSLLDNLWKENTILIILFHGHLL